MNYQPVLTKISAVTAEEISWLWWPYVPLGKVTILDGLPGTGKTYFALSLAAALSNGGPIFDQSAGEAAKVIYMTREDGLEDTIKPRLDKMNANGENILILKGSKGQSELDLGKLRQTSGEPDKPPPEDGSIYRPFDLSQLEVLETALKQTRPRLAVVDNIASYLGPKTGMNNAQGVALLMNELADLAHTVLCAFLIIRHPSKRVRDFAVHTGAGSYAFAGVVRSMLLIGKHPQDLSASVMVHNKYNLSTQGPAVSFRVTEDGVFEWGEYCDVTASQLMAPDAEKERFGQSMKEMAKERLVTVLENGPLEANVAYRMAGLAGISERTLDRAKDELNIKSLKSSEGWIWVLPLDLCSNPKN